MKLFQTQVKPTFVDFNGMLLKKCVFINANYTRTHAYGWILTCVNMSMYVMCQTKIFSFPCGADNDPL